MRFLAINTAAKEIEIAVCFDDLKICKSLPKAMAAEQLLPLIDEILNESKIVFCLRNRSRIFYRHPNRRKYGASFCIRFKKTVLRRNL